MPRRTKLYLAGPMTGLPNFNYQLFDDVATMLRGTGRFWVNSPTRWGREYGFNQPWEFYARKALGQLVESDAVAVLSGWENSKGARLEVTLALNLGMVVAPASAWACFHTVPPRDRIVSVPAFTATIDHEKVV